MSVPSDIIFPIKRIDICPFPNDEIRRYSVTRKDPYGIFSTETIDKGEPVKGGVLDPRLGSTNQSRDCNTCGLDSEDCPCHMGHIKLPFEVFNKQFIDHVKKYISCLCLKCSRIPLQGEYVRSILKNSNKFTRIETIKKATDNVKVCPFCNEQKPKIRGDKKDKKENALKLYAEYTIKMSKDDGSKDDDNDKKKLQKEIVTINGYEAFNIFCNVSDEDHEILGIDPKVYRLSDLIHQNYPVSALAIRPSVKAEYLAEGTSEDDLTKKTLDIVKTCDRIRKTLDQPDKKKHAQKIDTLVDLLTYNIQLYSSGDTKNNNDAKVVKSIDERVKGKEGRLRHDLEGKRTNFCARSVISADPNISINQGGIPLHIAMILTIRTTVTNSNIKELTKCVRNGRDNYPGANYVISASKKYNQKITYKDLKHSRNFIKLQVGDIVERHLQDNDPLLFNRQPSLHKPSIMCHKVKIIKNPYLSVLRLNVNVTSPYGADFDGDEMNVYGAQSIPCLVEYVMLALVDKHILSPAYSKPIISFKQDTPAGIYLLTEKEQMIDWQYAMNIACHIEDFDFTQLTKENITSQKLFSFIIPKGINYVKWSDNEKVIEIVNGELKKGKITASIMENGLIMTIWDKYGAKTTRKFIDNAQRLAEMYLFRKGVSIGYRDIIPSEEIRKVTKHEIYSKMLEACNKLTEIENNPDMLEYDIVEKNILAILGTSKDNVGKMSFDRLNSDNGFYVHVDSGAKGSIVNIGAIMGGKGQEKLKFQRIDKTVNGRSLPHFCLNDDTPLARGYIVNSYYEGTDPLEFWFYHQGGREGIINTSIKTAESGYQQRRLIKALESIHVAYDGTVRTSNYVALQLLYGDNQLNQVQQKKVLFKSIKQANNDIRKVHEFTDEELSKYNIKSFKKRNVKFVNDLIKMRNIMRINQLKTHFKYGEIEDHYFQSVNYQRIIDDELLLNDDKFIDGTPLDPEYILESIENILKHENTPLMCYSNNDNHPIKHNDELTFKFLMRLGLYEYLSVKRCLIEYKLTREKFDNIVKEIINGFNKSLVEPGEMVGILAAQSSGEPLTQMTLSSFHKSGQGVAGLQGTPRLKEILGNGKNIATPFTFVYMKSEYRHDKTIANKIASSLRYTTCKDIIDMITTLYDPLNECGPKDDMDMTSIFMMQNQGTDIKSLPWLYRIRILKEKLIEYNINMLDIKTKFISFWNDFTSDNKKNKSLLNKIVNACIITNYTNSKEPYIHIRLELSNIDDKTLIDFQNLLTEKFYIKGTEKIKRIEEIANDPIITFDEETGKIIKDNEYVIYTAGINFDKLRYNPYIDQNRTICNDIRITYEIYGIEATRSLLLKEISGIFSKPLNYHHVAIICDLMTHTGSITSIDRFGLNKLNISVLSKATFEETMEILTDAAVFNQSDYLKNVSSSIMLGKPFKGGTGLCEIMLDTELLENSEFNEPLNKVAVKGNKMLSRMTVIDDIIDTDNNVNNFYIPK